MAFKTSATEYVYGHSGLQSLLLINNHGFVLINICVIMSLITKAYLITNTFFFITLIYWYIVKQVKAKTFHQLPGLKPPDLIINQMDSPVAHLNNLKSFSQNFETDFCWKGLGVASCSAHSGRPNIYGFECGRGGGGWSAAPSSVIPPLPRNRTKTSGISLPMHCRIFSRGLLIYKSLD
jgi:hypothetical protein